MDASPDSTTTSTPSSDGTSAEARAAQRRRRVRRVSPTRRLFLRAINAQIAGTRLLAFVVTAVLLIGGFAWLLGTTGSPVIGVYFIVLAGMLGFAVYWFLQVMGMFTEKR